MGLSAPLLDMHIDWMREGLLRAGTAALDMGAQELFCADDPASLNRFVEAFGGAPFPDAEAAALANNGWAGDLFTRAGFAYQSIDIVRGPHVLPMDLNVDTLPAEHHGRYQWVTNHGTSEHILNQWNVFKTMHDACAVGGVMYHNVPMVEPFHGIFSYSPKLFRALAKANGYEIIRMWTWRADEALDLQHHFEPDIHFAGPAPTAYIWFNVMLRRAVVASFSGLVDCIADNLPTAKVR